MNVDERENYGQEGQNFQDETRNQDHKIEVSPVDHPISNNAEPDFGNDLVTNEEFNNDVLGNEDLGSEDLADNEVENDRIHTEIENQDDNKELGGEVLYDEGLGNIDEDEDEDEEESDEDEDEINTDRPL